MNRVAAGLCVAVVAGFWAALIACSGSQSNSGPEDGGIKYKGDGPSYSFGFDAGSEAEAAPTGPVALLSAYFLDLGSVGCGTPSVSGVTSVINNGTGPLQVSVMITGSAFTVSPTSLTVPAGGLNDLIVTATVPGSATAGTVLKGSLIVTTNDPNMPNAMVPLQVTPTGATIVASPPSGLVSFPTSEVGRPASLVATVTNSGNGPATISVGSPSTAAFTWSFPPDGGVPLNPGDSWNGPLTFVPPDTSLQSATASVSVSGTTCGTNLSTLSFTGQGGYGNITGWPPTVDFGPADCGGGAPGPQSFQVTNVSTVNVRVTNVSITPPHSGFTTDAAIGQIIGSDNRTRTFHVTAPPVPSPSPLTPVTATLSIQTDADTAPHLITLQEEPNGAVFGFDTTATPNFGSFGPVVLLLSSTQQFSVTNTGTGTATVTLTTGTPPTASDSGTPSDAGMDATADADAGPTSPFTVATPSFTLGPNGTQTDAVTFVPPTGGGVVDAITMTAQGPVCSPLPAPLPLSGVGLGGGLSISPSAVSFGATCGAGAPATQTVMLQNIGPGNLTWSLSPITGPGAAQFTVTPVPSPGLLPPGRSVSLLVTAAAIPSPAPNPDPAALAAQFTISTDIPLDSPHVVPLSEIPLGDQLSFSVNNLRFGQWPVDRVSPQQTFTITNAANAGSYAANLSLALAGDEGSVYVEPEDGGAVCVLSGDSGADAAGACPVAEAGADAGDAGDAGCGDGSDCPPPPELISAGYLLALRMVQNLGAGGAVSSAGVVTFVPTTLGPYPATIAVQTSDALCTPLPAPLQLTGVGTNGNVSISSTTLAFGTDPRDPAGLVNCGATGLPRTLSITNTGNQPFNVTGLSLGLGSSSPYVLSGVTVPALLPIDGTAFLTVTPSAIPASVADPNDPSPFSDTLTITTDAMFDSPHNVALMMQARGAVIVDRALADFWNFRTINFGSIGTFASSILNVGNAPALVSLQGLSQPTIFGLMNNPTTVTPTGSTAFFGQFTPPAAGQDYSDQGTLVVSARQSFCQPLPADWMNPTITLLGSSNGNATITVSGSLAFPASDCGSAPPGGQSVTISNGTNQQYTYAPSLGAGAFYTISDPGPGIIDPAGSATIVVTPNSIPPGPGVQPGSAPYVDSLVVTTAPASGSGSASSPSSPSFSIPISWTLDGAVLSLPQGAGPETDGGGNRFYPADTASGYALAIANTGTKQATVSFASSPNDVLKALPSQAVPAGGSVEPQLTPTASDPACASTASTTTTFLYSGPICQPLQVPSVTVHACRGTL
jgi:hypothetical protein